MLIFGGVPSTTTSNLQQLPDLPGSEDQDAFDAPFNEGTTLTQLGGANPGKQHGEEFLAKC